MKNQLMRSPSAQMGPIHSYSNHPVQQYTCKPILQSHHNRYQQENLSGRNQQSYLHITAQTQPSKKQHYIKIIKMLQKQRRNLNQQQVHLQQNINISRINQQQYQIEIIKLNAKIKKISSKLLQQCQKSTRKIEIKITNNLQQSCSKNCLEIDDVSIRHNVFNNNHNTDQINSQSQILLNRTNGTSNFLKYLQKPDKSYNIASQTNLMLQLSADAIHYQKPQQADYIKTPSNNLQQISELNESLIILMIPSEKPLKGKENIIPRNKRIKQYQNKSMKK